MIPLLAHSDADSVIAWRAGEPVSVRALLADASRQALTLPAQGPMVNLCGDRYRFAVSLVAALLRGHLSLLPPNALPDTLRRLAHQHPGLYGVTDDAGLDADAAGMPLHRVALEPRSAQIDAQIDARIDAGQPAAVMIPASQMAACLLTSGSTGSPTPHIKCWGTLVTNIRAEAQRLAEMLQRPSLHGLTLVATVPAQHSYGFESSVLLAMLGGCAFDAGRPFYPADIALALDRVPRPRALVTTPFHLNTLLRAGIPLPTTDLVLCATAPLSPQLAARAEQALGGTLVEIYGCTEAGQVATRRTVLSEVWHTFGELAVRTAPDDTFIVEGGHVAQATPLADVLQIEDPSHFRLLGRATDLIRVAGKRSSLGHLNYHLNSIAGVEDGAFWLPDDVDDGVVRPIAFVVAPGLDAGAIIAALRARLEAVFVPRRVVLLAALPREATGKLTVAALRQLAQAHV